MLTITANTEPYYLPTPANAANSQRVLGTLQTYFCINKCNPVDPNGYVVDVSPSGSDYLIRYYNVETNVDDDESLSMALFQWNGGLGQQQLFPTLRGVSAFMTDDQAFADNTPDLVEFDSEDYDTDNYITPTDDTFVVPIDLAGYYQFDLDIVVSVTGGSSVYFVVIEVLVDSVVRRTYFTATRNQQAGSINATVTLNLAALAEVQIQVEFQGTGSTDRTLENGSLGLRLVGI